MELSPSAAAMTRFIQQSRGLQQPRISVPTPGLPTLPDLKKLARDRRDAGHAVIDQSAGDIDDVGQPLNPEFGAWVGTVRDRLVTEGHAAFRQVPGSAYGFPGNYQQQYPVVTEALAASWGMGSPYRAVQTVSGRTVLDFALRGLLARARSRGLPHRPAVILEPLAWSGYKPLASDLDIALVHQPAVDSLTGSTEGLRAALDLCARQDLSPIAAVLILPSNPSGAAVDPDELARLVDQAARADLPVLVDAFYSPLDPRGHASAVPLARLGRELPPETLSHLGVVVGETKVSSSQNKTGTLFWAAPPGHADMADLIVNTGLRRMRTTNSYPRPQEALVALALHTFAGGIQAAMGPRYLALDATRSAMRAACDALGLPLSIGGSFYGTVALVDDTGESLIRDEDGRPVSDPASVGRTLIHSFGLVGAPGGMFSSAPEANKMVRLTAAVTLDDVAAVGDIFAELVRRARHHG